MASRGSKWVAQVAASVFALACAEEPGPAEHLRPLATASEVVEASTPAAPRRTATATRARYVAAVQEGAGPAFHFAPGSLRARAQTASGGFLVGIVPGGAVLVDPLLTAEPEAPAASPSLRWTGVGRAGAMRQVESPIGDPVLDRNRATWSRADGSDEWYVAGPLGVEHGFTLPRRPEGKGPLVLEVAAQGFAAVRDAEGGRIVLETVAGRGRFTYRDLLVTDAAGTPLPAWFDVTGHTIAIHVEDGDAVYPLHVDPLLLLQTAKLVGSTVAEDDTYGSPAAISGDHAIVGAHDDDTNGEGSGAAYVFEKDGAGSWIERAKLLASDGLEFDHFGEAVSISGTFAIVGARDEETGNTGSGSAYVFERDDVGAWVERTKLTASDADGGDHFGYAVAISGDRAIVGAPDEDDEGSNAGAVYVYELNEGVWLEVAKLTAADAFADDGFGKSVSISGDRAIAGAPGKGGFRVSAPGKAYIFERSAEGTWLQVTRLSAPEGGEDDKFGISVSISGEHAIVGAPGLVDPRSGAASGSAYVFERDAGGSWLEEARLTLAADAPAGGLGSAVSISADRAIVSGGVPPGAALVFRREGGEWTPGPALVPSDPVPASSVGISGDHAILGAFNHAAGASRAAYVFENPCAGQPDGTPCDDGLHCTGTESCVDGYCDSSGDPCAGNAGDGDADCSESCSEERGDCTASDPSGAPCEDDGLFCTGLELCQSGECRSSGDPCDGPDEDAECAESCREEAGACTANDPDGSPCPGGTCADGSCVPVGEGGGGSAGVSGTSAASSTASSSAGPGGVGGHGGEDGAVSTGDDGCGCRLAGAPSVPAAPGVVGLLGLLALRSRRRRAAPAALPRRRHR